MILIDEEFWVQRILKQETNRRERFFRALYIQGNLHSQKAGPIPDGWKLKSEVQKDGSKTSCYWYPATGQHFFTYEPDIRSSDLINKHIKKLEYSEN